MRKQASTRRTTARRGMALVMVIAVLGALAIIGAPFVVSMMLHDRASQNFSGAIKARQAAESYRNRAVAGLEATHSTVEWENEYVELEEERELQRAGRRTSLLGRGGNQAGGRQPATARRSGAARGGTGAGQAGGATSPAGFSSNGPSKKDFDTLDETEVNFPTGISLPRNAPPDPNSEEAGKFSFRSSRGITASAEIVDEQGKININTAPPNLIANLFGVSRLRKEFRSSDKEILLEDSRPFRGDERKETIDGAVVLVHPEGNVQAVTYKTRDPGAHSLGGLFPGSFLSGSMDVDFPVGSFVYDLKGWKIGFHRFWAERYGGFHPDRLTSFRAVESIREIAHWQIASLFVGRFRGQSLDMDLLKKSGVRTKSLGNIGLDPAMFADDGYKLDVKDTLELGRARKQLTKKQGFSTRFLQEIERRRGPYMVLDLAARLRGATKNEGRKVRREMEEMFAGEKESRKSLKIDSRYLKLALAQLAEVYATAGIETILPEDLEYHRDALTVSSRIAARWSEAQSIGSDLTAGGSEFKFMVPRAPEFNPGTVVRLRSLSDLDRAEFNVISKSAGSQDGGVSLAYPPRASYRGYKAVIEALQRHPVNVNSASEKVLRALFTGIRGRDKVQVVTPYEAARLAVAVRSQVPMQGHEDFYAALQSASSSGIIDDEDVKPLFVNAVQPTNYFLRQSTTGLCYSTADVYTIEARALLRNPSGSELAGSRFREIVAVSPAGVRIAGMVSQADYADGIFLQDPKMTPRFPENNHRFRLRFPGTLSHLVESRPVMLHRGEMIFPGADVSTLRLLTTQTPKNSLKEVLYDEVLSFEDTYEGMELEPGEPYELSIGGGNGQAGQQGGIPAAGGRGGAGAGGDLTTKPAGVEFWFRMKSYPKSRSRDGYYKLLEGGSDPDRNRMALLYDESRGRVLFRIYDSSLPDPLMKKDRDNGSFLQIEALRGLELETWYHVKLAWDGTFGGGAQLFIDGIPAGKDNLSTELTASISGTGKIGSIGVKDASRFPSQGSVRIGAEIFEYIGRSKSSLQVRPLPPSHWKPLPIGGLSNTGGAAGFLPPGADAGQVDPAAGGAGTALPAKTDPRLWNGRGSIPSPHPAGSLVSLHGYSLEIRRKVAPVANQGVAGAGANPFAGGAAAGGVEHQVADGDSTEMVWGTGGMSTAEPLNAWNFPTIVRSGIYHYFDRYSGEPPPEDPSQPGRNNLPGGVGGANPPTGQDGEEEQQGEGIATNGDIIVPLFKLPEATDEQQLPGGIDLPAGIPGVPGGQNPEEQKPEYTGMLMGFNRSSSDYFQSKGICHFAGKNYQYQRIPLPPEYLAALNKDPKVEQPPAMGLKIMGPYPAEAAGAAVEGLTGAAGEAGGPVRNDGREQRPAIQLSVLANGVPMTRYPSTGVLEIRGMPSPWEIQSGRPNMLGRPLMAAHPDDTVEWVRYREVFQNMFVGRLGSNSNFRGYPVREQHNYLKKQMDVPAGQPIRLVMELGQGGAGWGDFVTITTSDPDIYETMMRRVYKAFEHEDGRFFVSLVDVDQNGREMPVSRGLYRNNYFRGMNPRLVKFPSWGLPEISTGSFTLFGDAKAIDLRAGAQRNQPSRNQQGNSQGQGIGGDESNGITIDEVRRFENRRVAYDPTYGPRVKYVLVPLKGGRVEVGSGGAQTVIGGAIGKNQSITRSNPLEVLVVSVSIERGQPSIFALGMEEGVIRIGRELFYFEDEEGAKGGQPGSATRASPQSAGYDPSLAGETNELLAPYKERQADGRLRYEQIQTSQIGGHFEPEGFALMRDGSPERSDFYELFYYGSLGGGFKNVLRGQFSTPYLKNSSRGASTISNATRKLRLIGRTLLATEPMAHGVGDACSLVPYLTMSPITGAINNTGIPVKRAQLFAPNGGYVMIDPGRYGQPMEIISHMGIQGDSGAQLRMPRDQRGEICMRARFGTQPRAIGKDMFAYQMPFRYFDRYEDGIESESMAFLQKSFRVPGAYWRSIEWKEREGKNIKRDRLCDIIVVARLDREADWDAEADARGSKGLYLFEETRRRKSKQAAVFDIDRAGDELELRVYFRYKSGSYMRVRDDIYRDDWKETPVLESLVIEYEKDGAVVRHEELPR
ncbi:MAG: hypothetical protein VYD81_09015 [Planctomycetota bacterium]|nr:hypothetical protein [Planctomycetota bacterium]